jgi:hypothetical protein
MEKYNTIKIRKMEEDNKIKVWEQEREVVKDLAGQS